MLGWSEWLTRRRQTNLLRQNQFMMETRIHSMEGYLALDLLILKRIWNVVKHLEFAKDVELLLNPHAKDPEL